jgi:hypothetical protein
MSMNATSRRRVRSFSPSPQADLFTAPNGLPEGFCYRPNVISRNDEEALAREVANLPFKPFDFMGTANRQLVSFGYRYDYDRSAVVEASPFPSFLVSLRNKVAAIFDRPVEDFRQALITSIDRARESVGIATRRSSTRSSACRCSHRVCWGFRRKAAETWDRVSLAVEPCSAYLLRGPPAPSGSTAFPRSMSFVIQSPCGRSLRRPLLVMSATSLYSFRLHRKNSTGFSARTMLTTMPAVTGSRARAGDPQSWPAYQHNSDTEDDQARHCGSIARNHCGRRLSPTPLFTNCRVYALL